MGAFLRYDEGSAGPYDEILAAPTFVCRNRRLSFPVPFIAVDSEASLAGGRDNWAIPKTLAEFDWHTSGGRPDRLAARGNGWAVEAHVRSVGPRMLIYSRGSQVQVRADGEVVTVPVRSRGIGRLTRVEVSSDRAEYLELAAKRNPHGHRRGEREAQDPPGLFGSARLRDGRELRVGSTA